MWKYLGQRSFPMSEKRYMEQLDAVAELVTEWGVADQVRREVLACPKNPVLDTTGANAVHIALDVDAELLGGDEESCQGGCGQVARSRGA